MEPLQHDGFNLDHFNRIDLEPLLQIPIQPDLELLDYIQPPYQRFAQPFGSPHQILALVAWEDYGLDREDEWWGRCNFSFTFRMDDDCLSSPPSALNLSRLPMEPIIDHATGEEIGERPLIDVYLNRDEFHSSKLLYSTWNIFSVR